MTVGRSLDGSVPCWSTLGLIVLGELGGVGSGLGQELARRFDSLGQIEDRQIEVAASVPRWRRDGPPDPGAWDLAFERATAILDRCVRSSISVVSVADRSYPASLKRAADRPAVLFVRGRPGAGVRSVACIGTRRPSEFGVAVGRRLTGALVERGFSIVSGLALGIDTQVHRAALRAGGHTIAVLGNGLDHIYPEVNERLAEEIVAAGGALVSEKPPGVRVTPGSLVARDRIQTGLSAGVVVIQTDLQGGPMHGARFALSQGRPLFVPVPGGTHADHPKSRGLLALATVPARELAGLIGASGRYRRLLEELDSRPVATALRDRGDYSLLFEELERSARRLRTES